MNVELPLSYGYAWTCISPAGVSSKTKVKASSGSVVPYHTYLVRWGLSSGRKTSLRCSLIVLRTPSAATTTSESRLVGSTSSSKRSCTDRPSHTSCSTSSNARREMAENPCPVEWTVRPLTATSMALHRTARSSITRCTSRSIWASSPSVPSEKTTPHP